MMMMMAYFFWAIRCLCAGKGNVTSTAEFNFYADPEAANVVLNELHCSKTLVPWELCLDYSLPWVSYSCNE